MLKLETGSTYTAARFRSGSSDRGEWELIVIRPEGKSRQEITIFPVNVPSGIREGDVFSVQEILSVSVKKSKDRDGNWGADKTSVDAFVKPFSVDDIGDFGDDSGMFDCDDLELEL